MDFFTPEFFNTVIVVNMIVGLGLAGWRFYREMQRAPFDDSAYRAYLRALQEDTQPHRPGGEQE